MMVEKCAVESCGFEWDAIGPDDVAPRIIDSAHEMSALLAEAGPVSSARPDPSIWSPLEYAGHVRDVLFNIRDRIIVGLNEDNPLCKGLYGTPRIEMGLYAGDGAQLTAEEVQTAASLFARTWQRIPRQLLSRTMVYGYPEVADRTLMWVAAQALHEVEHHLNDIRESLTE